ncbi:MAG: hypothetical protein ACE5E0_02250 [Terriglobia bacterium]
MERRRKNRTGLKLGQVSFCLFISSALVIFALAAMAGCGSPDERASKAADPADRAVKELDAAAEKGIEAEDVLEADLGELNLDFDELSAIEDDMSGDSLDEELAGF